MSGFSMNPNCATTRTMPSHTGVTVRRPALATRGLQLEDFTELGQILAIALTPAYEEMAGELAERVGAIVDRYPLYQGLLQGSAA